jgi:hypothetical protein
LTAPSSFAISCRQASDEKEPRRLGSPEVATTSIISAVKVVFGSVTKVFWVRMARMGKHGPKVVLLIKFF